MAPAFPGKRRRCSIIRTNLYQLIAAVSSQVPANEGHIVVATVRHLLKTNRVTYSRDFNPGKAQQPFQHTNSPIRSPDCYHCRGRSP
jgi:hypothetical protein